MNKTRYLISRILGNVQLFQYTARFIQTRIPHKLSVQNGPVGFLSLNNCNLLEIKFKEIDFFVSFSQIEEDNPSNVRKSC